ncbi:MAG: hypothetical protein DCC58_13505 [Chloroflexi bacterium]|nr:MAG: hypothetical protein DCC58_13505 [Chloroflexota bacterium]
MDKRPDRWDAEEHGLEDGDKVAGRDHRQANDAEDAQVATVVAEGGSHGGAGVAEDPGHNHPHHQQPTTDQQRGCSERYQHARADSDDAAEEVNRPLAQPLELRHDQAGGALGVTPGNWLRPGALVVRAGRAVPFGPAELAPATVEGQPGEGIVRAGRLVRHDDGGEVVALVWAFGRFATETGAVLRKPEVDVLLVEAGVRATSGIDDWSSVLQREPVVVPVDAFPATVLGVDDADRLLGQRFFDGCRVEVKHDHFPVALVVVVPVVEVIEHPVLQGELVLTWFQVDVGVGNEIDLLSCQAVGVVAAVDATGVDWRAGEIEEVAGW